MMALIRLYTHKWLDISTSIAVDLFESLKISISVSIGIEIDPYSHADFIY